VLKSAKKKTTKNNNNKQTETQTYKIIHMCTWLCGFRWDYFVHSKNILCLYMYWIFQLHSNGSFEVVVASVNVWISLVSTHRNLKQKQVVTFSYFHVCFAWRSILRRHIWNIILELIKMLNKCRAWSKRYPITSETIWW
jgi:hypothetical protein